MKLNDWDAKYMGKYMGKMEECTLSGSALLPVLSSTVFFVTLNVRSCVMSYDLRFALPFQ